MFRKLSKVKGGKLALAKESDVVRSAANAAISIPTNTSTDVSAVTRSPGFALSDLLAEKGWANKVCYAAILPKDYGVDLEAEYRDYLKWKREHGAPLLREEEKVEDPVAAAREIDLLRMPSVLVYAWLYRTETGLERVDNPAFERKYLEHVADRSPLTAWEQMIETEQLPETEGTNKKKDANDNSSSKQEAPVSEREQNVAEGLE